MNPVRSALRNRSVVLVLTGFAVLLGVASLFTMPRREDPKLTIRTGLVLARYPGASAQQVEDQVTRKIEARLFRHEEVRKLKTFSTSRDGIVVVNVELEEWVKDPDRFWAMLRHDMNELRAIELPQAVQGPIVNSNFGDVVAMLLAVRGPHYGPRELREYLDQIDDAIRTIPEVSRINRLGEQREELRVSTTNARLAGFGITPPQVAGAIRSRTAVIDAGTIDAGHAGRVPIAANNLVGSEDALSRLLVGSSPDGRPVYLGDFATVDRRYADPQFVVRVDGESTVLLAIEMQEGHNIVKFGDKVREKLTQLRATLPADLVIQPIADQPAHVQHRMIEFGREFLITLAAVVLVTVLLLPLRVAAIAAVAIPITVAITAAILNAVGIELHQVTFAGLVVALGIVVDDAIVVVDNYVEKLDHGMSRLEAAWRSPTELAIPVLAATLTIVASFMPLAYLPGAPGEFIRAMSYTVAIALMVSFAIAMLLTPMLALTLVKAGLHAPESTSRRRRTPLDVMQSAYERAMGVAMPRKRLTMIGGVVAFVGGLALMSAVPYRFFPMNERDQLIVDLWMPAGTRLAGTDEVLRRLENEVRHEPGVRSVAAFTGGGAPRFYYNHNPEPPAPNFGELLINTASPEATTELVHRLHARANQIVPEGWVYVKPLQQGPVFAAPNEVRLVGDDAELLRTYGDSVARIFERTPGSAYVHTDWRDEELALGLHVRPEVATRLGLADADIATQLAGAFAGAPIATYWEGKRDLDVTFRLDGAERSGVDDVAAATLVSPATGARVPLREVASVAPEFRASRIVRRNGVRTLTVRSFAAPDILPSVVLKAAAPKLAALALPVGMRMEFGGEKEGSAEVQGAVNVALMASLVGVFLILLFQFRTVRHPLVIMTSIPLALVGAALGLVITANPFTYTANLGLNALTGVVVRNAIILVDYANELRRGGIDIETAALLAGRRRLRPIFLTTMAAALGMTPMILSRSPLWSPMASVIAVGLVVSMIFTLVLVPVLYVAVERREERRAARHEHDALDAGVVLPTSAKVPSGIAAMRPAASATLVLAILGLALSIPPTRVAAQRPSAPATSSSRMRLTLDDAVALAMKQGYTTNLANARFASAEAHERGAAADLLPQVSVTGNHLRSSGRTSIVVPRGALGNESSGGSLPAADRRFDQGSAALTYTQLSVTQPVTQLWRIRQAQRFASAQTMTAAAERARAEADVRFAIERLYASVLIARARERAAEMTMHAMRRQSVDAQQAVASGIDVSARGLGAAASALDAELAWTTAADSASDAESELRSALALPPGTQFELAVPESGRDALSALDSYVAKALAASPDVAAARATVEQTRHAAALARADYIPDVGVGVTYTMLDGVSFLPRHAVGLSIQGSWTVFDWGKRGSVSRERAAQEEAAATGLALARDRVLVEVERAYRAVVRAERAAEVAGVACDARRAALNVTRDRSGRGLAAAAPLATAEAELAESEAHALAAQLQIRIARAALTRAIGGS